jgi:Xaa-Pro dipeptidase
MTHSYYAGRTLRKGDIIFFEIGGCIKRYHGACVRSASVGKPKEKITKIAEVCKKGLDKAVEAVRPGATSHEVDKACWEDLVKAGLEEYRHRCGYSIGIEWSEGDIMSLRENDPSILKPGMVFHMPGPTIMVVGEGAIGFSETVLVTKDGHEVLSEVDRELFIR